MGLVGAVLGFCLGLAIGLAGAYLVYLRFSSAARSLQVRTVVTNHHRPPLSLSLSASRVDRQLRVFALSLCWPLDWYELMRSYCVVIKAPNQPCVSARFGFLLLRCIEAATRAGRRISTRPMVGGGLIKTYGSSIRIGFLPHGGKQRPRSLCVRWSHVESRVVVICISPCPPIASSPCAHALDVQ
jgi:hypothetical protein